MHPMQRLERIIDRAVPWLILVLVPLIVAEFFVDPTSLFGAVIDVFDWFVISVLALDLVFKFRHATSFSGFFKGHWLEVVSLLPVFVVLRVFEELRLVVDAGGAVQEVAGEVVSVEQEAAKASRSASRTRSVSRLNLFRRLARPIARLPRFSKAAHFYMHPDERGAA